MRVKRGQVWSLLTARGERIEVRVKSVRGPVVRALAVRTARDLVLRRVTMERGQRGARLVGESKASPAKPEAAAKWGGRRKAKSLPPPPPSTPDDKMLRLFEEERMTLTRIAERMGVSRSTAGVRIRKARSARDAQVSA